MDRFSPAVTQQTADVAAALTPRLAEVSADVYQLIAREIPQLRTDHRVFALLEASVGENIATVLHILEHDIDLTGVHAPAAAEEYARRLAQRDIRMPALLRAYRLGATRFQDWCLQELGRRTDDAAIISAAGMRIAEITASYVDLVSEEVVAAYEAEKENWLRNLSAARAARVRAVLGDERVDVDASEAILGYRLRQHHAGVVCWVGEPEASGGALARLEHATVELGAWAGCDGRPVFIPQDECTAWAWLPLGGRDTLAADADDVRPGSGIRFALGAVGYGLAGFRGTHRQALAAHALALAAGPAAVAVTSFDEVAPLALMVGSIELLRDWVVETLGPLAGDGGHNDRLRETLLVFIQQKGSFKATAERLTVHKNTVQYRVRKAEESLGGPVDGDRLKVELALMACQWLGPSLRRQG